MGVPLYVICHFSLVAFNILSVFTFCQFDYSVSRCVPPWVYPLWGSLYFLDLVDYFLSHVWEVFSYYIFKYFLRSSVSLFSFLDPYNVNIGVFRPLRLSLFFFPFFFQYSVLRQWFPPFCPPGHLSVLLPQLFCYWFHLYLSFSSYRSLVNVFCIFPILHSHYSKFLFWKVDCLYFI